MRQIATYFMEGHRLTRDLPFCDILFEYFVNNVASRPGAAVDAFKKKPQWCFLIRALTHIYKTKSVDWNSSGLQWPKTFTAVNERVM